MMIDRTYAEQTLQFLAISAPKHNPIWLEPGLADHAIESIQERYGLLFPPDLRLLLQTALPLTDDPRDFPDWRHGDSLLHYSLEAPRSCIADAVRMTASGGQDGEIARQRLGMPHCWPIRL